MTSFERFESRIPLLLEDLAVPRPPDYADDLFARTAATRQRPGWTFPERWLPVSAITRRLAVAPRVPWRLGVLVALLAIAALVAVLVAGSLLKHGPAPYGPAANGGIAMVSPGGDIVVGDPTAGAAATKVLVPGPGNISPLWSRDGAKLLYLRTAAGTNVDLMVVNADGSHPVALTERPIPAPRYVTWSAHSDQVVVNSALGEIMLYDAGKSAAPTVLSSQQLGGFAELGIGYNASSLAAVRPPDGNELLFVRHAGGVPELMAVRPDGSGLRTLIDAKTSGLAYKNVQAAQWSPDGSEIVVLLDFKYTDESRLPYILNADGSDLRPLGQVGLDRLADLHSPIWSPDGTRIAFQYWRFHADDGGEDFFPIQVVDVATDRRWSVGPRYTNGYISWEWSPDGTSILEVPGDETQPSDCSGELCKPKSGGSVLIANASDGTWTTAPWVVSDVISWQRVAP